MIPYPNIDPTIVSIGSLEIKWYGFLYVVSFVIGHFFLKKLLTYKKIKISKEQYENLIFQIMLGVIIGGRLGYVLFYNLPYYLQHPLEIILPFDINNNFKFIGIAGMSFHGGALGVIISGYLFCRKNKFSFYTLADPTMPFVAIGLGLGRIGNFINGELYGRISSVPWSMIFPNSDGNPRHPSQLYEMLLEGLMLSSITFFLAKKNLRKGTVFWAFIGLYGIFRFFVEFTREPDEHLGFIIGSFTMGQILSSFMIISAIIALSIIYFIPRNDQQTISN